MTKITRIGDILNGGQVEREEAGRSRTAERTFEFHPGSEYKLDDLADFGGWIRFAPPAVLKADQTACDPPLLSRVYEDVLDRAVGLMGALRTLPSEEID